MAVLRSGFAISAALSLLLMSCASTGDAPGQSSVFDAIFGADLSARQPRGSGQTEAEEPGRPGEVVYLGSGARGSSAATDTASSFDPGEYSLNFQSADLREVVQAVLGDALGRNYTIDPKVGGTITISSARPLSEDELLTALESALKMNGAALVREGDSFKVVEQTAAIAGWVDFGDATPGFGMSVLPLRHVSARTVISLIDGFAAPAGTVRAEAARNLLIVLGTSAERQAAIETALSFDQDWMEDQAVAIVPLRKTKPETIVPELERIFKADAGDIGADVVQFVPMSRLRAVLVVAAERSLVERARTWVQRLDSEDADLNARVYVYRVKYRDAQKLAALISQLFAAGSPSSADEPAAQIEPNAAAVVTETGTERVDPVAGPAEGLAGGFSTLAATMPDVQTRIQADPANNSIVIYADAEMRREILTALSHIDVPQLQVAIHVTMAEIRLTDELRYGVQFFLENDEGSIGLFGASATAIGQEAPGFNFLIGSQSSPDVIITAFDEITDVQILSSPSLVVVENETANFQVGDQVPIVTRTVTSVEDATAPISNEVEYRDTGIILQVKPRISENGLVQLQIEQEISAVASASATLTPTITNRKVSSSISVVDGQTVLLGGLISAQVGGGRSGIPGLSRILGQNSKTNNRTELIILIRPSVIRDSRDAQSVAEELRARMWNVERSGKR